jgi:DNA-binding XRE family transcriptional regulator
MPRATARTQSRYTQEALALLGALLRAARIDRKMGTQLLAERAGISRDMLYRIEKGDPRCEIGVVFELAAILGVPLFEPDLGALQARRSAVQARLALLPKAVHAPPSGVKDDF